MRSEARLANRAAERLQEIDRGGAKRGATATANRDQSDALEEVAVAVRQMDEMTQPVPRW